MRVHLSIVVPLYKVRLDDVLNRKHLPPLGECFFPLLLSARNLTRSRTQRLRGKTLFLIPSSYMPDGLAGVAPLRGIESRKSVSTMHPPTFPVSDPSQILLPLVTRV